MAAIVLPADFVHEHDDIAWGKMWPVLESLNPRWIKFDEHIDPFHAGFLSGNGTDEEEMKLAEELFPRPGMDKRAEYGEAVARGQLVRILMVEFVQYKSELKVVEGGKVSVRGCLKVRARPQDDWQYLLVCILVPAWKGGALILPGEEVRRNPRAKNKGYCLELEVETVREDGESLDAFWDRCREDTNKALTFGENSGATVVRPSA
jgi:hypothetical protein